MKNRSLTSDSLEDFVDDSIRQQRAILVFEPSFQHRALDRSEGAWQLERRLLKRRQQRHFAVEREGQHNRHVAQTLLNNFFERRHSAKKRVRARERQIVSRSLKLATKNDRRNLA